MPAKSLKSGARDGARTRDLRRDRPYIRCGQSATVPTRLPSETPPFRQLVGTPDVYPTDAGDYAIGLDGPAFPTRRFAEAVAAQVVS